MNNTQMITPITLLLSQLELLTNESFLNWSGTTISAVGGLVFNSDLPSSLFKKEDFQKWQTLNALRIEYIWSVRNFIKVTEDFSNRLKAIQESCGEENI